MDLWVDTVTVLFEYMEDGYSPKNEEGKAFLEFTLVCDLVLANKQYIKKKRESRLITFKSGSNHNIIDFILAGKGDRVPCKDLKVIPAEAFYPT